MPYVPKTAGNILRALKGAVIGRTALNDINEGSTLTTILSAVANEIASVERRLYSLRESFYLNGANGADLDERVRELPAVGIERILATNASGTALYLERAADDTADALVISAGSTVRSTDGARYVIPEDVVIPIGDNNVDNVLIIAETPGSAGNKAIAQINAPGVISDRILVIRNTQPLTNGVDREADTELRERASLYLRSLSRCQRSSIEFMAKSFISSEGERFPYAQLYESIDELGYSELNIDDGSGISVEAVSRVGTPITFTTPSGGARTVFHESPATASIPPESIRILVGGDPNTQIAPTPINYTSIPERGIVYFKPGMLNPGDVVSIQGYRVYRGAIAEIQREIEGNLDSPERLTGFRAAGTRIVVKPVSPQFISLDISLLVEESADYNLVEFNVLQNIAGYVNGLAPGEVLYISRLIDAIIGITGVKDLRVYERNTTDFAENVEPRDRRTALRVRADSILITSTARD